VLSEPWEPQRAANIKSQETQKMPGREWIRGSNTAGERLESVMSWQDARAVEHDRNFSN
jgi:hypothetical protein